MTDDLRLEVGRVLTPTRQFDEVSIEIEDGFIRGLSNDDSGSGDLPVANFRGATAVPGFIDVHCHGYDGVSTTVADSSSFHQLAASLARHGVTTVYPTTVAAPPDTLRRTARQFGAAAKSDSPGARLEALHLEGPYLSEQHSGAQNTATFRDPDPDELDELRDLSRGQIGRLTVAPERPGGIDFINHASAADTVVSAGHTDADFETANQAFDAGLTSVTHLYNAMRSFHHREPGLLGATLTRDDIYAELIADLIHVHPAALRLAVASVGIERAVLVTDSISATGRSDGEYDLGGLDVVVEDGVCRVADTGALAGSTLTMDAAIRNLVHDVGIDLVEALTMATENPARMQSLDHRGQIAEGYRGDLALLDDDLQVVATVVGGEFVYRREQ